MSKTEDSKNFAIRFGLGSIKAVGFNMTDVMVKERQKNGKFKDIYDFAERLDPKLVNKKSIEALAKSGAFESIHANRCQVAESFDVISSYSSEKKEEASSNQMSLFCGLPEANKKPELKKVSDWGKNNRLQKEFEAFGFFLNEHPLDDHISDLKKRGTIFSTKLENDELEDDSLVKMAGVIAASKHRSGPRGRFAYLTISDPFGIFEAMIFDEALITSARDILSDGSVVVLECLIRKDGGGVRILVRDVKKLEDFIQNTKAAEKPFEDIKKQKKRSFQKNQDFGGDKKFVKKDVPEFKAPSPVLEIEKKIFSEIDIIIQNRDSVFAIKSLLSQCLAPLNCEKFTAVFLSIKLDEKTSKLSLPQKYFLGESELSRLRSIAGVAEVKFKV